jgi:hypothetical protein
VLIRIRRFERDDRLVEADWMGEPSTWQAAMNTWSKPLWQKPT